MKKTFLSVMAGVVVCVFCCSVAHAALIGDTISLSAVSLNYFENSSEIERLEYDQAFRTVTTGVGDVWNYPSWNSSSPSFPFYAVNPEDTSVRIVFAPNFEENNTLWFPPSMYDEKPFFFNGVMISGIDANLTGVTIDTNMSEWDNSRLAFDAHSVQFDWMNLRADNTTYFNANFDFDQTSAVPEPATALLFAIGGAGLAFRRRCQKNA